MSGGSVPESDSVVFEGAPCARCGKVVGEIRIQPPGRVDPDMPDSPPGLGSLFADEYRITRERLLGGFAQRAVGWMVAERVKAAVSAGDLEAIYRRDHEFAQFYCPSCQVSYCSRHWTHVPVYDDMPGRIDYLDAICPEGHRKNVEG